MSAHYILEAGHLLVKDRFMGTAPQAEGLLFAFNKGNILLQSNGNGQAAIPQMASLNLEVPTDHYVYLGQYQQQPCFGVQLPANFTPANGLAIQHMYTVYPQLPAELYYIASYANHIVHWHRTHRYCGVCGHPTTFVPNEGGKRCTNCGHHSYPRISPAVIVAVVKDGKLLLGASPRFKGRFYSVIAGFVDPGESLETTVKREVKEETNIEVENIRYFDSQPWPFPDSLMVGFVADYKSGEIQVDQDELIDAGWYGPDEMPKIPPGISIARRLIDWFIDKYRA